VGFSWLQRILACWQALQVERTLTLFGRVLVVVFDDLDMLGINQAILADSVEQGR
jgi:hypothetical protein